MTSQPVPNLKTPIGEILKAARADGLILESEDQGRYAVLLLEKDLIDFLVERNPKFRADCRAIRTRMDEGQFLSHEEVKRTLVGE